jgi:tetratricopeptide (TPR) repeat protein
MTTTNLTDESFSKASLENQHLTFHSSDPIDPIIEPIISQFDQMMRSYVFFNLFFLAIGCLEFVLLVIFFTILVQSAILALSLAVVFLTFFSYFILRLYFQTRKAEQFLEIKDRYITACRAILHYQEDNPEDNIALANACSKFADSLRGKEFQFYYPPHWLKSLHSSLREFSYWCHWSDVHRMRELLMTSAVEENIRLVKCEPTNLEAHAALANAYVMLSSLYADPFVNQEKRSWFSNDKLIQSLEQKFRTTAERAIEEFKILNDFAPDDPWVHIQLAYSYHDLKMPLEEIREYETIISLSPEDTDALFKLGKLYFEQGQNASGLRIYEQLKHSEPEMADKLINCYGAYQ